jgi:hypothetical protein
LRPEKSTTPLQFIGPKVDWYDQRFFPARRVRFHEFNRHHVVPALSTRRSGDLPGRNRALCAVRPGHGTPPSPEWKRRNYIRDILPKDDPHLDEVKASPALD